MSNYDSVRLPPPPSKNGYRGGQEKILDITWGEWIPAGEDFCVPGDVIRCGQNAFVRTVPLVTVPFTAFHLKFVTFFTPIRVLDEDATKIITGFDENDEAFEGSFDTWKVKTDKDVKKWSYYDYFSFQTMPDKASYDSIPDVCKPADYWRKNLYRIYNEWLREPHLQDEIDEDTNNDILHSNYHRDRYTAALLSPQLGAESTIGLEASNSVTFNGDNTHSYGFITPHEDMIMKYSGGATDVFANKLPLRLGSPNTSTNIGLGNQVNTGYTYRNDDGQQTYVQSAGAFDLSAGENKNIRIASITSNQSVFNDVYNQDMTDGATYNMFGLLPSDDFVEYLNSNSVDINGGIGILDMRLAFANQLLAERLNRTGSRYNEFLRANYGVAPRDETLQRPVFLGSSICPIMIDEVTQTSESNETPLGDIAGKGVTASSSYTHRYLVKEFGIVQTLMTIVPDVYYSQGIPKKFTYKSKDDFFKTLFQCVGEVEILNSEIYVNGTKHGEDPDEDGDDGTFGFEPIYEELRHPEKRICGAFRDDLKNWTLAREFSERPHLNGDFVQCQSSRDDLNRIFVTIDDTKIKPFHVHLYNDIRMLRPIIKEPIGASLTGMR